MGKMATTLDDKLSEFQEYLLEKNLAPAKNVPFYAHWVGRFLDDAGRNEFSTLEYQEAAVLGFLEFLKSDSHVQDWRPARIRYRRAADLFLDGDLAQGKIHELALRRLRCLGKTVF